MTSISPDNPGNPVSLRERFEQAFELAAIGVPVRKACRRFGIGHDSYYRFLREKETPPSADTLTGGSTNPEAGPHQQMQADDTTRLPDQSTSKEGK